MGETPTSTLRKEYQPVREPGEPAAGCGLHAYRFLTEGTGGHGRCAVPWHAGTDVPAHSFSNTQTAARSARVKRPSY